MKIQKVVPQKRRKKFHLVYIEGRPPVKLHEEVVIQNALSQDKEISVEKLEELIDASLKKEALEYAYMFFNYRSLSEHDLESRLNRKGFTSKIIRAVIKDLKQQNIINDSALARNIAESSFKNRLHGKQRIQRDLIKRGLNNRLAEETVSTVQDRLNSEIPSEEDRAYLLLLKRCRQIKMIDLRSLYRRLFGYLSRRGFSPDTIEKAFSRYKRDADLTEEDH